MKSMPLGTPQLCANILLYDFPRSRHDLFLNNTFRSHDFLTRLWNISKCLF